MKTTILALLLLVGVSFAQQPQKIVVGGSNNATLGQVLAGYNNGYNIGIRIPVEPTTLVQEDTPLAPFVGWVSPNPCERTTRFIGEKPRTINVFTMTGVELTNAVNMTTGEIKFIASGMYIVKVQLSNGSSRTFTVISK